MPRYKIQLVPQGAVARPLEIGVRMTPLVEPGETEAPCVSTWEGWLCVVDFNTQQGATPASPYSVILVPQDALAWDASVTLQGDLCPGDCLEWTMTDVSVAYGSVAQMTSVSNCQSIAFSWASPDEVSPFGGTLFMVTATLNGNPFGFPQFFVGGAVSCVRGDSSSYPVFCTVLDFVGGGDPWACDFGIPGDYTYPENLFSNDPHNIYFSPSMTQEEANELACGDGLKGNLSLAGGNPSAYGDFVLIPQSGLSLAAPIMKLEISGVNAPYTGIAVTISPQWESDGFPCGSDIVLTPV